VPGRQALAEVAIRTGTLPDLPRGHFLDGAFRPSARARLMESFDPGRATPFAVFARGDADDVDAAVVSARRAFASPPFLVAVRIYCHALTRPSSAIASATGLSRGLRYVSKQCVSASMPVAAVR